MCSWGVKKPTDYSNHCLAMCVGEGEHLFLVSSEAPFEQA